MTKTQQSDERWMRRALALARRGEGLTRPNPPVGAVIVAGGRNVGCFATNASATTGSTQIMCCGESTLLPHIAASISASTATGTASASARSARRTLQITR